MKRAPALFALLAAQAAFAQAPAPQPDSVMVRKSCEDCGVVRSIRKVESKQPLDSVDRGSTAGLVATIPLHGGKPLLGSSTEVRKELKPASVTWEVVVRLDNGSFRIVLQDDPGPLREEDKVKIVDGKVQLRGD
jgi:hypothetical protein